MLRSVGPHDCHDLGNVVLRVSSDGHVARPQPGEHAQGGIHVGRVGAYVIELIPQGDIGQQGCGVVDLLNAKPDGLEEVVAVAVEAAWPVGEGQPELIGLKSCSPQLPPRL